MSMSSPLDFMDHEMLRNLYATENDKVAKLKVPAKNKQENAENAEIVARSIKGKPYYEIKYYDTVEQDWCYGYGSYNLMFVEQWLRECFNNAVSTTASTTNTVNTTKTDNTVADEPDKCVGYVDKEGILEAIQLEINTKFPEFSAEQEDFFTSGLRTAFRVVQEYPATHCKPVRKAFWIREDLAYSHRYKCSNCLRYIGAPEIDDFKHGQYCPDCGSFMTNFTAIIND